MSSLQDTWYRVQNAADVPSPALLLYPDRIEENVRRMIRMAGGTQRLRPHIKTHKLSELVRMQMDHGIGNFKCATIAEAEMAAGSGALDVLLAYQPVGPNVQRMLDLLRRFPGTRFSAVVDDPQAVQALSLAGEKSGLELSLFLDIDCGMHRTGILPSVAAVELYQTISRSPGLKAAGLHAYDGHLHERALEARTQQCDAAFLPVARLREALRANAMEVPAVVAGGTPTFPIHAQRPDVECSPGTCLLWDSGYSQKLPDLDFLCAAVVLTRVVSKPGKDRLCLDLGHKAVASENPHPRVQLLDLPGATAVTHSEEHLVVETSDASQFAVGDAVYGIPWHICPTVALYSDAVVVRAGKADGRWSITARRRALTI